MALVRVEDSTGEEMTMRLTTRNRYIGPYFTEAGAENFPKIPLRSDDLLLLSYPKCGCHWLWENIRILLKGEVTRDSVEKDDYMMEARDSFDHLPSPRVLNNHGLFDEQNPEILKGNVKIVFIYRNPKDVAVSFYHHHSRFPENDYNGVFPNYLHRYVEGKLPYGSYFDYLKSFEEGFKKNPQIPHIIMRYEDLHTNPIAERRRVAEFLGKSYDDSFLEKVRDSTTIDTMRVVKNPNTFRDEDGKEIIYRKGKVGDWKDNFTVSQSDWLDDVTEEAMADSDMFPFKYTID